MVTINLVSHHIHVIMLVEHTKRGGKETDRPLLVHLLMDHHDHHDDDHHSPTTKCIPYRLFRVSLSSNHLSLSLIAGQRNNKKK